MNGSKNKSIKSDNNKISISQLVERLSEDLRLGYESNLCLNTNQKSDKTLKTSNDDVVNLISLRK